MKRAIMSELAIVRTLVPSIAGVGLFIFVVLTLANATDGDSGMSAGACAVSAMSPIIIMNSLAGYDNQNGWERYRATLPFSRKDIICARYLCIVVFSVVMACAATLLNILALPLFDPMGIPSTCQTIFEIAIASAASMLISLMMVFLTQPLFFRFGHMEALRLSLGLLPCLAAAPWQCWVPPTPSATGSCRLPERIPIPPFLAVCVQELPYWPSRYVQSAAPSAPRFIEYATCNRQLISLGGTPLIFSMKQGGIASPPPLTTGRLVLGNQKDTVSISKVNTFPRSERVKTVPCSIDIFKDSIPAVFV